MENENTKCTGCYYRLIAFLRLSRDELLSFLRHHGVILKTKLCETCNEPAKFNPDTLKFSCRKRDSGNIPHMDSYSLRKHTIFENSHLKFETICDFIVLQVILTPRPAVHFLSTEFNMTAQTTVHWLGVLGNVYCEWAYHSESSKLGGSAKIVEIGFSKFTQQGAFPEQWLVRGFERESKSIFIVPIKQKSKETLLEVIKQKIRPETILMSLLWKEYDCLNDEDYIALQDQKITLMEYDGNINNQSYKRIWRDFIHNLPTCEGRAFQFDGLLAEFLFKRRFFNHLERIHEIFTLIGVMYNPTGKNIKVKDEINLEV